MYINTLVLDFVGHKDNISLNTGTKDKQVHLKLGMRACTLVHNIIH